MSVKVGSVLKYNGHYFLIEEVYPWQKYGHTSYLAISLHSFTAMVVPHRGCSFYETGYREFPSVRSIIERRLETLGVDLWSDNDPDLRDYQIQMESGKRLYAKLFG